MKFKRKYPNLQFNEEADGILKGRHIAACEVCGELTDYIEMNYEAYFCSDECVKEMDRRATEQIRSVYGEDE